MIKVRVASASDPTLDWGAAKEVGAYFAMLAALPPNGILRNARVELAALQLSDRAMPIVIPVGIQNSWLTSLTVTYGRAARDEVARDQRGLAALLFRLVSSAAEGWLRLTRADQIAYVNHPLFATSLYGRWTADDLDAALSVLRTAFPKRAIVWRSLNAIDTPDLLEAMDRRGARRLVSRMVWSLADPAIQWAPRTDVKSDRQLAARQNLTVESCASLPQEEMTRVIELYEGVYLSKYSATNPAYTSAALRAAFAAGALGLDVLRDDQGQIQAFAADHVYENMLSSPMLGHDRDKSVDAGLYRIAMALPVERALKAELQVNYSAGAGTFKRNRGAVPTLEFVAVFDSHLPAWRRAGYFLLSRALAAITPAVERIALR